MFPSEQDGDDVPPAVAGAPDRPANANGWYDADVTIDWSSVDPDPSSGTPSDPPDTVASLESTNVYTRATRAATRQGTARRAR